MQRRSKGLNNRQDYGPLTTHTKLILIRKRGAMQKRKLPVFF